MSLLATLKISTKNLIVHKSRSILTIIGIVIGITAIMIIVSVGSGVKNLITDEITSLGADVIWIEPGREPRGPTDFATVMLSNTLKTRDIEALKQPQNVPGILDIAPAVAVSGGISYMGETYRPFITGWSANFMSKIFKIEPEQGVYFDDLAIKNREKVAVIGSKVKDELFGENNAIGKSIRIKNKNFKVIGVLPDKGQIMFFDIGSMVLIPYTTAQSQLLGIDYYNEVWLQVKDVNQIPETIRDIEETLRSMHGITDPEKDDFYILTQQNILDQIKSIVNIITALVGSVVAISLIVGGIGVMNIMLVSVAERTREIGLRKAVGATENNIRHQFMLEAIILTTIGGLFGILIGSVLSIIITIVFSKTTGVDWSFNFPFAAAILGFLIASAIGLIFGTYPAGQAAKKDPIDALRYE
jgi:putative ABC transport system permease protein